VILFTPYLSALEAFDVDAINLRFTYLQLGFIVL